MRNNQFPSQAVVAQLRETYPDGCRVELLSMSDPYTNVKPGEKGTVLFVDDIGTVFVFWDCGSSLGVAYWVDQIKKL